ncbi:zinc finger CCCH domain-containing protein 11A isoform X2 [Anolis sagrei]|uniref:zinc finger CCCH domain-containing protein 11A isoform X2 n=1 Tax=Anolis sagrei TaxID=38937 RepID=UPI003522EEDA
MSNQDDCYFYYYSKCSKGKSCPFRHCEAALGSETVCALWKEGRCFRNVCQFRHMEINKKRSEIPCYWEKQPLGCLKSNCAFHHTKARFVDGLFLPPSKTAIPNVLEPPEEEIKISVQQNKLSVQSNPSPQLRGVMKVDSSENVPSPAHPPVVINAADDDEDDDDQLSEENEEAKIPQQSSSEVRNGLRVVPTQKPMTSTNQDKDGNLNFGIKTLEEIKSKKAKQKTKHLFLAETDLPTKRNLAERLGKRIHPLENADRTPKTVPVRTAVKERLGFPFGQKKMATENAATPEVELLHMKTLEEIQLEKTDQRKRTIQPKPKVTVSWTADDSGSCAKPSLATRIKTFSEAFADRKQKQIEEQKQGSAVVTAPAKIKLEEPSGKDKDFGEVRIKTLEEIKREKALRMRQSADSKKTQLQPERTPFERRLQCITKPTDTGKEEKPQLAPTSRVSRTGSTVKVLNDSVSSSPKVHVKSLQEIKKEKQESKPQEKQEAVAAVGGDAAEAKALMTTNPASPVKPRETQLLTKRLLEGSKELAVKKMRESKVSSQPLGQIIKAKSKVNVEPSAATLSPPEHTLKQKTHIASVKPLAKVEEISSKRSELHEENWATASKPDIAFDGLKSLIPNESGPPNKPCADEDEIEKLMWEIADGTLEDEIELEPGKDQDDLLLELSEMIDS